MGRIRGKDEVNESRKPKKRDSKPQWANMAGITISRPMGRIRGKDKVSGRRKSKKKCSKLNGPTWQE